MPIYSYVCEKCGAEFDQIVLSASWAEKVACPVCGSEQVERRPAVFGIGGSRGESRTGSTSCAPSGGG
ncbi:MAG: FmdB family zinc ribbon protein [Chloroflexia bacterium]